MRVVLVAVAAATVGFLAGREVWPRRTPLHGTTVRYEPVVAPPPVAPEPAPERPKPPAEKPGTVEVQGGQMKIVLERGEHRLKKHGFWTERFPTGEKKWEGEYIDGLRQGAWRTWHKNGRLMHEGTYERGAPVGLHRQWYDNGDAHIETAYEKGKRHGVETLWHRGGVVASRTDWKNGRRHGIYEQFDSKGRKLMEGVYENGRLARPMQLFGDFGSDADLEEKARVKGKYSTLLARVAIPTDVKSYTRFNDYGFAKTSSYAGRTDLPPGYWVYVYPYWYIWKTKTDR